MSVKTLVEWGHELADRIESGAERSPLLETGARNLITRLRVIGTTSATEAADRIEAAL